MKRIFLLLILLLIPFHALGEQQVTVTFLGDCTIGGEDRVRDWEVSFDSMLNANGYAYFFEKVQSIISADDLTVANLEGVFRDHSNGRVEKTYNFRGPDHFVNVLTAGSVEAVSLANNHVMDFDRAGARHTTEVLDDAGVAWFGTNFAFQKTWIYEKNNVKIGFLAVEIPYWGREDRKPLQKQIAQLKESGCQVVVAVMHGGTEYDKRRDKSQEKCSKALMEYGADVVIGHHPHVLQGIEVVNGKTVCYSLGNFVFGGNAKVRAPYTAIFQFSFSFADGGEYLGHQLTIYPAMPSGDKEQNNYQPVLLQGEEAGHVMGQIQHDTHFHLNPCGENGAAVQAFVPAAGKDGM